MMFTGTETPEAISSDIKKALDQIDRPKPNITAENDCGSVMVKIGGVVHIHFRFDDYRGLQTWKHSDKYYCIEISLADGANIKAGYDSREKWETVIASIVAAVAC